MPSIITRLVNIGINDNLIPYEQRRARIFNYSNLAGFAIAFLRLLYVVFSPFNQYSVLTIVINALPLLLCGSMALCMKFRQYKRAIAISFIFFPPALVLMTFITNDGGMEAFLFLYMMFTFFFLHKIRQISTAFVWVLTCFVFVHYSQQEIPFFKQFVNNYQRDNLLSVIDYSFGFVLIFITMYFIKFEVWKFENSIRQKKDELKNLNAVKDKVFSVIAHDLRTPLESITMLINLLDTGVMSKDQFMSYIPELRSSITQTTDLLNNLLVWAKSQIKQTELFADEISLARLTEQTMKFLRKNAEEKKVSLINEISGDCYAWADESSTKIVLRNLVANAIKFTPSGGCVKVKSTISGDFVSVIVEDNGIGISVEKQVLLFGDNFYSTPGTNRETGTGLGLLICKDLVQKNGGNLSFISEPGNGSVFSFSLPLHD